MSVGFSPIDKLDKYIKQRRKVETSIPNLASTAMTWENLAFI